MLVGTLAAVFPLAGLLRLHAVHAATSRPGLGEPRCCQVCVTIFIHKPTTNDPTRHSSMAQKRK
jgi:hypothetical protein